METCKRGKVRWYEFTFRRESTVNDSGRNKSGGERLLFYTLSNRGGHCGRR
jgi:hypothetical protein